MGANDSNSLPDLSRDNDRSYQLLDGHAYGLGDRAVNSYAKSPYTDPDLCALDVGPQKTRFLVHRMVLGQSPELEVKPFSKLWGEKSNESIALPDLDEPTAHTFVHYLYSGRYQADKAQEPTTHGATVGYKLGTCVYCAAIRYKLPGLAELAKGKITSFGEDLTILDILCVAREHAFPNLPEEETWFPEYLEDAIKTAGSENPGLFAKPEFVEQMGDGKFRQVVMQAIVNSYNTRPAVLRERHTGLSTPVTESKLEGGTEVGESQPEASERELEKHKEDVKGEPIAETAVELPISVKQKVAAEELRLDDIEPTPQTMVGPEPFTDELGWGNSKTYQKLGKKSEPVVEIEIAPKPTVSLKSEATPTKPEAASKSDVISKPDVASKTDVAPKQETTSKPQATPAPEVTPKSNMASKLEAAGFVHKRVDSVTEPTEPVTTNTPPATEEKTPAPDPTTSPASPGGETTTPGTTSTKKNKKKKNKKSAANMTANVTA